MNILFFGEYNKENLDFVQKFENGNNVISRAFWTSGEIKLDCFHGDVESEEFKTEILSVLFGLAFEPDVIITLCSDIMDAWAISSLKRYGLISCKCFSVVKNINMPVSIVAIGILDTFEKNFVFGSDDFFKTILSSEIQDLKQIVDSIVRFDENEDLVFEKIIKGIENTTENINCEEVHI